MTLIGIIFITLAIAYGAYPFLKPQKTDNPIITIHEPIQDEPTAQPASEIPKFEPQKPHITVIDNSKQKVYLRPKETTSPLVRKEVHHKYQCDGRIYCSQMTSCEEATWFLQNCPGVKMDGGPSPHEPDGIPCEKQWCH